MFDNYDPNKTSQIAVTMPTHMLVQIMALVLEQIEFLYTIPREELDDEARAQFDCLNDIIEGLRAEVTASEPFIDLAGRDELLGVLVDKLDEAA